MEISADAEIQSPISAGKHQQAQFSDQSTENSNNLVSHRNQSTDSSLITQDDRKELHPENVEMKFPEGKKKTTRRKRRKQK